MSIVRLFDNQSFHFFINLPSLLRLCFLVRNMPITECGHLFISAAIDFLSLFVYFFVNEIDIGPGGCCW